MKNNKSKITAVAIILLVVIAVAIIIKVNSNDEVEPANKIEAELNTPTPTLTPVVKEEETIDNDAFIANIDVIPEREEQEEKVIPLSTEEVIFKEPVIEKSEPKVQPEVTENTIEYTDIPEEVIDTIKKNEKEPEKKEVKTSETIKIAGIKFPILDSFNTKNISTNSWGNDESSIEAINEFHYYIPSVTGDSNTGLVDYGYRLTMSVLDSSSPNLDLTKDEDEKSYKITLFASLEAVDDDDNITKLNRDTLLMFCSLVSSTPQKMYSIIYDSFETDETHGLSTETYKTFGDFQIKYSIASDKKSVTYYVKAK